MEESAVIVNLWKEKFFFLILIVVYFPILADAKQFLPDILKKNTITITAQKTGELGKNYFYCSNGNKCSTEQVVREYYKNNGYNIMRAEYSFWKGIFVLAFLDEFYPHTLNLRTDNKFFDKPLDNVPDKDLDSKYLLIYKTNLQKFINSQIEKHEGGSYIRWLDEWEIEGYKNPIDYFKSPVVQEFLTRIDNKTFCIVLKHILEIKDRNPVGTPDYIVWNNKEMIFVEVKRKNEKLSLKQIEWGEYLTKNKILYKVIRVEEK